jgi:MerR family mercuric resistance operon transcriptional regulator
MTGLRSSQLAAAAGVNPQTLRYYERRGLLTEPRRSLGGHRLYPAEAVAVLRVIKAAQRLGFTLDEVTDLLDTGRHRHSARPDAGLHARAQAKLAEVAAKIADLQVIAGVLRAAIDAGCDDLAACADEPCCPIPFAAIASPRQSPKARPRAKPKAGPRMCSWSSPPAVWTCPTTPGFASASAPISTRERLTLVRRAALGWFGGRR